MAEDKIKKDDAAIKDADEAKLSQDELDAVAGGTDKDTHKDIPITPVAGARTGGYPYGMCIDAAS